MKRLLLFLPVLFLACEQSVPTDPDAARPGVPQFTAIAEPPAQYCKEAAPEQFFNACTVCAAQGSDGPIGDTKTCACKTIMDGFFGPPPYQSFGECMLDWK